MSVLYALIATTITWGVTALGASLVFFVRKANGKFLSAMLGFSGGVMTAASFFSLLLPAIEYSEGRSIPVWLIVLIGFLFGILFMIAVELLMKSERKSANLMLISITTHNIPEGFVVGVAFALAGMNGGYMAAITVGLGIALQNFPEGLAVALPLRKEGMSRFKCFFLGQMSAIVEPIAGVLGAVLVSFVTGILPYALAFSAAAMIWVVAKELIPDANEMNKPFAIGGYMFGFIVMMTLDIALG